MFKFSMHALIVHDKIRYEAAVLCDSHLPAIIIMTDTKMVLVFRSFLLVPN